MRKKAASYFVKIILSALILSIVFIGLPSASNASTRIDAGDLLNTIIDEIQKDHNKTADSGNAPSSPSSNTKSQPAPALLRAFFPDDAGWIWYIIEEAPQKKGDGSLWHKMIFDVNAGLYYQVAKKNPSEYPAPTFDYPYVNAKFIEKKPMSQGDKEALDDFKQGRPCRIKIGDKISGGYFSTVTEKQLSVYLEPNESAKKYDLPKNSKIIYPSSETEDPPIGAYLDINDILWVPVIGANDKKVIAWVKNNDQEFWENLGALDL